MGFLAHIFIFILKRPLLAIILLVFTYLLIGGFFKL